MMNYKYVDNEIKYIGSQLSPHWLYKNFNFLGDSVIAFCGGCDVKLSEMVDIEDVINNAPIYSENMLHFISEQFNISLREGVFRQRMLVVIAKEVIEKETGKKLARNGDDLFYNGKKLSVSIATTSYNSVLIHFAMNIVTNNTPIPTSGLQTDLEIENIKQIAEKILVMYNKEIEEIEMATCKVRGVN